MPRPGHCYTTIEVPGQMRHRRHCSNTEERAELRSAEGETPSIAKICARIDLPRELQS